MLFDLLTVLVSSYQSRKASMICRALGRAAWALNRRCFSTVESEVFDYANRKKLLVKSRKNLYPLLSSIGRRDQAVQTLRIPELREKWADKAEYTKDKVEGPLLQIQGRINSIRSSGKNLLFIDLVQDFSKVQIVINRKKLSIVLEPDEFLEQHKFLRKGDIVSVIGHAWKTKRGEFSILADEKMEILAPCFHPLPVRMNETTRLQNRVVDLAANSDSRDILRARATVLSQMRSFFDEQDFTEVQTPILASDVGGATAKPFITVSNALTDDNRPTQLSLRIAPELWLKRLVIGGFDKVYEIGTQFRNEGIDATHNPEFTTCEFYQSYTTLEQLMQLTEQLLVRVSGAVKDKYPIFATSSSHMLSLFSGDIQKHDFISSVEKATGEALPTSLENVSALTDYCRRHGVPLHSETAATPARLLDSLSGHFIEPLCGECGYIVNHPAVMAPLAKTWTTEINGITRTVSRRFELFYKGKELVNAYEEENSPFCQEQNFKQQLIDRNEYCDDESPLPDQNYVKAMELGLPPTGGWGIGIDRLVMMVTGSTRINQVLSFGGVKAVGYQ